MANQNTALRPQLITLQDVSEMLALSPRTVRNRGVKGSSSYRADFPPAIVMGSVIRYDLADITAYIEAVKEAAA